MSASPSSVSPYLGAMLAHEYAEKRVTFPVAVEPKLDGIRITFVNGEGYTRNGRTFPALKPYAEIVADAVPEGVCVDVEAKARNWNDTSSLLKRIKNIDHERIAREVTIHIFDAFTQETIDKKEPYSARRKAIEWLAMRLSLHVPQKPSIIVRNSDELTVEFNRALAAGFEGVMVKPLDGAYMLKRSWAWMKIKPFKDITVTIKAVTHGWELCRECMTKENREHRAAILNLQAWPPGAPLFKADDVKPNPHCPTCRGAAKGVPRPDLLGALVCVDEHGNEWGVGMGFTDADKKAFMASPPIGKKCDVKIQDEGAALAETSISRNDIVARHAVFLRFREDI